MTSFAPPMRRDVPVKDSTARMVECLPAPFHPLPHNFSNTTSATAAGGLVREIGQARPSTARCVGRRWHVGFSNSPLPDENRPVTAPTPAANAVRRGSAHRKPPFPASRSDAPKAWHSWDHALPKLTTLDQINLLSAPNPTDGFDEGLRLCVPKPLWVVEIRKTPRAQALGVGRNPRVSSFGCLARLPTRTRTLSREKDRL